MHHKIIVHSSQEKEHTSQCTCIDHTSQEHCINIPRLYKEYTAQNICYTIMEHLPQTRFWTFTTNKILNIYHKQDFEHTILDIILNLSILHMYHKILNKLSTNINKNKKLYWRKRPMGCKKHNCCMNHHCIITVKKNTPKEENNDLVVLNFMVNCDIFSATRFDV